MRHFSKSFTSYLHNRSTSEHNSNRFRKLQQRTTTQVFGPFLVIGHVTTIPTSHQVDPNRQNHSHLGFLHFLVKPGEFHFSHPFQGTYEVYEFFDLRVPQWYPFWAWYTSTIPIPWYHGMENPYHIPLIPIPCYHTNTMLP